MDFASRIRHVRSGLVAGLVALAAGSACVQEQDYLIVERAVWFDGREDCTLDESALSPLAMTVDVAFQTRIAMGFVITNEMTPNAGSNSGVDDSTIEVESVEVNLSYSGGAVEGGSFELPVPNNSIRGEESGVVLVQVPTEVTESLRASLTPGQFETLEMEVVFVGRRSGASGGGKLGEVKTRAYTYPFDVCLGCLANNECGVSPTVDVFAGVCGFAQGMSVYHPDCDPPEENSGNGETGP